MIVGRGLIATAFLQSGFDAAEYVVFASGVSNSSETRPDAFEREIQLLESCLSKDKTIIYFSTTSLFDPTKKETPYILHKRYIEGFIQQRAASYAIIRLPILLGHTPNPHTLINFLLHAIRNNLTIPLHLHACRHLLDIDDLIPLLSKNLDGSPINQVINIPGSPKIAVPELVRKIERILQKEGSYTWEEKGACYDIPASEGIILFHEDPDYIDLILNKYIRQHQTHK